MEQHFSWFQLIPGVSKLPDHTVGALVVSALLIVLALRARRQLQAAADPAVPDGILTARDAVEIFVEKFSGMAEGVLGHNAHRYLHLYGTFFIFILAANFMGLIPGINPPTSSFNVTLGLGITSFLMYNYYGLREHGAGYVKHFLGPIPLLAPLMLVLELIDNFVRPVSLGLRLFGNMIGDHLVLGIFTDLTYVAVPVVFYVLGSLVCFIQAFVFTMLSMVYLSLALGGHGDHTEHAH